MGKATIIQAGALTTVQDLGRWGFQHLGMPVAGAMDTHSIKLANWLVNNPTKEACLECTFVGPEIKFEASCDIAVTGAIIPVFINNKPATQNTTLKIEKSDVLSFGQIQQGLRFYIAFSGGIDVPIMMNSKSTYLRGKLGGFKGRKLEADDEINFNNHVKEAGIKKAPEELLPTFSRNLTVRILPGTEVSRFSANGIKTFLTEEYTISPMSDRMGYRLSGKPIEHLNNADIISSGIPPGSIQIPGDGQPIIMMADRQTIGGYTKIANVIQADIPKLAQMKPGDKLRFKEIKLEQAQELYRKEMIRWDIIKNKT